jgi:endonuclease/exonuclease/phosphatase family metal-dependent hydrolase
MLRLLTYNVRRCLGTDRRLSPARIAEVIASCAPDIVALQELDVGRARTNGVDQAHAIAHELGMLHIHFHPTLRVFEEQYGDAILTTRPSELMKAGSLPGLPDRPRLEPRGAIWVSVRIAGINLQVINTHLGLSRRERLAQVNALVGPEWLGLAASRGPVALVGDFNAPPLSQAYRRLAMHLSDAQASVRLRGPKPTFPSRLPILRIDHVFVGSHLDVLRADVIHTPLARIASDHLPLLVAVQPVPAKHTADCQAARPRMATDPAGPVSR